jgi:hypothetical protein
MNTKEYVQSLFRDYEESRSLKDFMEELQSNLDARIESLVKKGLTEQEAFDKASAELGDVSAIADELSLNKRREVFEEAYMDIRKYMTPGRVTSYVIFGAAALFGIVVSFITYFATTWILDRNLVIVATLGALLPFFVTSIAGFTFLGVTQETRALFPVNKKRAAAYTAAASLISFGLAVMPPAYFACRVAEKFLEADPCFASLFGDSFIAITAVLGILIPFVLPGAGVLVYLILTEKNRLKPWAAASRIEAEKQGMEIWGDPAGAMRFGLYSGAIWIFAVALFILLGFFVGFRYSWVIFIFAVAIELVLQALMTKKKKQG